MEDIGRNSSKSLEASWARFIEGTQAGSSQLGATRWKAKFATHTLLSLSLSLCILLSKSAEREREGAIKGVMYTVQSIREMLRDPRVIAGSVSQLHEQQQQFRLC